jgi:hypothetical protein
VRGELKCHLLGEGPWVCRGEACFS